MKRNVTVTLGVTAVLLVVLILATLGRSVVHTTSNRPDPLAITCYNLTQLAIACRDYRRSTGVWPTNGFALRRVVSGIATNLLCDGWGMEVEFKMYANTAPQMHLVSYGQKFSRSGWTNAEFIQEVTW
ncbi:exported hypothetical protein [Verrucomicrobia bacterium]|nr:exported hypothetical protein [Verrucomicrobiota bacterium]